MYKAGADGFIFDMTYNSNYELKLLTQYRD